MYVLSYSTGATIKHIIGVYDVWCKALAKMLRQAEQCGEMLGQMQYYALEKTYYWRTDKKTIYYVKKYEVNE